MNLQEFESVAENLASSIHAGRHLFFVHEPEDKVLNLLRASLKKGKQSANRLQIFNLNELAEPLSNREAVLKLTEKLKEKLEQIRSIGIPQFLVLTKPMLLVRYQIGLSPLYEYYLRDGTASVIILPSVPSLESLEALPNCARIDVEILKKPFLEVGRVESPLIDL